MAFFSIVVVCCLALSRVWLFQNLTDCSPPGSSVHGILQARTLEWVAMCSPGDLPHPEIELVSLALACGFFSHDPPFSIRLEEKFFPIKRKVLDSE